MGWNYIPEMEYTVSSRFDNPWTGNRSQPVGKISVVMPPGDWLCQKLESLNLFVCAWACASWVFPSGFYYDL